MTTSYHQKSRGDDGCCNVHFLKYVLFIFNFVFLTAGCVVLGVGLWTVIDKHHYISLLSTSTYAATTYILILAGVIVLFVTALGCVGIWQENRCLIVLYTFMLLLIFLLEAVAGVIAYIYEEQVLNELQSSLNESFVTNYKFDEARTHAIDDLQRKFDCCGASNYSDWRYSKWLIENPKEKKKVPDTCCRTETLNCGVRDHPSNIYQDGCVNALANEIKDHLNILGAVGLGICLVQVFGMFFSCCLYIKLRHYEEIRY